MFYCKTNVPQTLMTADSDNNVFGRTWNPHNKALSAGGSSGGEGALIAMRGSVVGIGTDIAGSIRIPSLCCGIYGFKPSAHVVPYAGQQIPGAPGLPGLVSVAGPMATSMRSCELILREVMSHQPWKYDVDCLHIPWNSRQLGPLAVAEREGRKLRIGILEDEGMFTPTPPMRRALAQAKAKLQRGGIETVDIRLPNVARDMGVLWGMASLEGSKVSFPQNICCPCRGGNFSTDGDMLRRSCHISHRPASPWSKASGVSASSDCRPSRWKTYVP